MRLSLLLASLAFGLGAAPSGAWALEPCVTEGGAHYAVTGVIDGETLKLDTGDDLRLSGVLQPVAPQRDGAGAWPPQDAAIAFLRERALGRTIEVRAASRKKDRYGRLMGHAFVVGGQGIVEWLQDSLVREGHARVFGLEDRGRCEAALLAAEEAARGAGLGLWANDVYRVRDAEDVRGLMGLRGTFQIIEGRVQSVAVRGRRVYLNFGRDWTRDFTVLADDLAMRGEAESASASRDQQSAMRKAAEAALKAFEGKRVRVRGWVRIRNGPMVEIARLEDVESIEDVKGP